MRKMPEEDVWEIDTSTKTNPSYGIDPYERKVEELLDCGIILINKPPGPSSHQLAAWARSLLGITRIGHGGTLDPFATGLLTLLCGRSTKVTGTLLKKPKRYVSVLRFKEPLPSGQLSEILEKMTGQIYNVPPKESAVKVQVRYRKISEMLVIDSAEDSRVHAISTNCEAGTYIRTLSRDLGLMLGNSCELLELHRQGSGTLDDSMACTMQQLTDAVFLWREHGDESGLIRLMSPIERILDDIPQIVIKDGAASAVSHGAPLASPGIASVPKNIPSGSVVLLSTIKGEAVAIATTSVDSDSIPNMSSGQVAIASSVLMKPGTYPQTWTKEQGS